MHRSMRTSAALLAGLLTAGPLFANPDITREGVGDRRAALDKLELAPFDTGLLRGLTDWRIGEPVGPEETAGKVVLIYTFAGYLPTAVRPIAILNRLADRYGDQGLVIIGVHSDEAYEDGVATAEKRRVTFPVARDPGNAMRSALKVDQDPDFFVIDRSGRMRFADIETASVERAVSMLIEESTDDAAGLLDRMANADAQAAEAARRTARLRSQIDLRNLPWVPFAAPSEEEYSSAPWPKVKKEEDNNNRRRGNNTPEGPVKLELNPALEWYPNPPENTEGRARLIYLFPENALKAFNQQGSTPVEFFEYMNSFQQKFPRDLIVIGAMVSNPEDNNNRRSRNTEPDAKKAEDAAKAFKTITRDMPVGHLRVNDFAGTMVTSKITPNNGGSSNNSRNQALFILPYHILIDSSGVVRWHGAIASSNERFAEWEAALDKVIAADPGIKARRAAEQAYIKSITE